MTRNDTIYLYQDENKPKVQLTLIKTSKKLANVIDYFHELQNLYNMEFIIKETITENLKVCCSSPGINVAMVPFYIIEYDEIYDSFYIWKSNGEWNLDSIIKNLYQLHNNTLQNNNYSWKRKFSRDKHFKTHPLKQMLISALNQLNLQWSNIDLVQFWNQFDSIYNHYTSSSSSSSSTTTANIDINEYTLKSIISMAVLKLNVFANQQYLKDTFEQYYSKIFNAHIDNEQSDPSSSEESILLSPQAKNHVNSNNTADIEYSSPRSSISPSPINPLTNLLTTESSYTYTTLTSTKNKNKIDSQQLLVNFNTHFKEVAENYENIQLTSKNKKLNSNHITSIKKNMNKINKITKMK